MAEILPLADCPQYLPIVAFFNFREWHSTENTLDEIIIRYQKRMQTGAVPLALVAVEDTMPVGTVSIKEDDLPQRPDLTPWLASLYVLPEYRGRGIGRELLRGAEDAARRAGVEKLYLFTHTAHALYEKEGWNFLEESDWKRGIRVSIYYKNL
jgi:GNAT superfamily N-acetyltransferase